MSVNYFYIRDPKDNRRVITVAWRQYGVRTVHYAVASNRVEKGRGGLVEAHCKADGRRTAGGRLMLFTRKGCVRFFTVDDATKTSTVLGMIIQDVLDAAYRTLPPPFQTAQNVFKRALRARRRTQTHSVSAATATTPAFECCSTFSQ